MISVTYHCLYSAGRPLNSAFWPESMRRCEGFGRQPYSRGGGTVGVRHLPYGWDALAERSLAETGAMRQQCGSK